MNERVIALDVGDVRIGVAVSDPTRRIAQPVEVYHRVGFNPDCRYVLSLSERFETYQVLLGLPLNMDGTRGEQAQKTLAFGALLEKAGLAVMYQDERLTTRTAESALIEGGVRREARKEHVDKVAAAVILEQWLQTRQNDQPKSPQTGWKEESMDEQESNIIQLTDEEGNEVEFEHLMTIEHKGNYYIMLQALEDSDDSGEGEALILKIAQDEKGEDVYVTIEDDEELDDVFEKFIEAMDEEDTEDGDEDEEGDHNESDDSKTN